MKTLFIADSVTVLNPKTDSTFLFAREALSREQQVFWCTPSQVEYFSDKVIVHASRVLKAHVDERPVLGEIETLPVAKFKTVWIRKDPPFDLKYVRLCWILSLAEKETKFLNSPVQLLRYHEKLVPLEAVAQGYLKKKDIISTHLGSGSSAKEFVRLNDISDVITKPFLGYGGKDIQLVKSERFLKLSDEADEDLVVQPYQKEVVNGDHRIFFLKGKILGGFARIPKEGDFVSNLAQGGSAHVVKLTKSQKKVLERLGKFLKKTKIFFAGADLIGNCISEVNITSPTGLRSFEALYGENLAVRIFDAI